ncbi:MAG: response regulator [Candidatus Sumerlaeaceae bacterium]|nr:response regulator [Candidatus Sumerlaeaceae bacterium]
MAKQVTSPKRVLVVDSDDVDITRICRELPAETFSLTLVNSPDEAEELIRTANFDAALIEVGTPNPRNISLLRRLRSEHPSTKVIMMTDFGDEELWVYMLSEGASDVVARPVLRRDLERIIC